MVCGVSVHMELQLFLRSSTGEEKPKKAHMTVCILAKVIKE